jgi:hypothetical protein
VQVFVLVFIFSFKECFSRAGQTLVFGARFVNSNVFTFYSRTSKLNG